MALSTRIGAFLKSVKGGAAQLPTAVEIPRTNVDDVGRLGNGFKKDDCYFQARINEMFLAEPRQWFAQYDPMVFVCSEFIYDKQQIEVPFVVGPSMVEAKGQKLPSGMLFSDMRVAGLHPYRGGRVSFTVILYQVQQNNWARKMLDIVANTAGALDFSTSVSSYVKVADTLLDGVEAVLGLGKSVPIVGQVRQIDPDAGDDLRPGYFVLIAPSKIAPKVDPRTLWVRDKRLFVGPSMLEATEFRAADYILFSIASPEQRGDVSTLPFYPQWELALKEAMQGTPDAFENAKRILAGLNQMMRLSPDLTRAHARALKEDYSKQMKDEYNEAVGIADLGHARVGPENPAFPADEGEMALLRREAMDILSLK